MASKTTVFTARAETQDTRELFRLEDGAGSVGSRLLSSTTIRAADGLDPLIRTRQTVTRHVQRIAAGQLESGDPVPEASPWPAGVSYGEFLQCLKAIRDDALFRLGATEPDPP